MLRSEGRGLSRSGRKEMGRCESWLRVPRGNSGMKCLRARIEDRSSKRQAGDLRKSLIAGSGARGRNCDRCRAIAGQQNGRLESAARLLCITAGFRCHRVAGAFDPAFRQVERGICYSPSTVNQAAAVESGSDRVPQAGGYDSVEMLPATVDVFDFERRHNRVCGKYSLQSGHASADCGEQR